MKIETTPREDHQVKLVVHIEADQYQKSMHRAARKIANRVKIPGFRPGKAPYDMILRSVGEDNLKSEAIELIIDDVYPKALKESNLTPGAMGRIENISEEIPPVIEFLVPLAPEVKLGDYHSIRKEYQKPTVEKKEVDEFVDRIRTNYATSEPVERAATRGDIVYLSLSGSLTNPAEGENPQILKHGSYPVLIPEKENSEKDWPFPGFGENLIGKNEGIEGTASYTYPEEEGSDDLRGKTVEFQYKVESVKKLVLPVLDDAFIKMVGEDKSVEEFLKSIEEQLKLRKTTEYDRDFANDMVEDIRKQATIKYPPQMLEDEIGEMLKSLEHDLEQQKMDLVTYLKTRNMEKDIFVEQEVKPAAINRLERSLVMDEFTHREEIKLDMTKWDDAVNETARDLSYSSDINQLRKKMSRDQISQAVTYETANRLMNQQIFDRMKAIATGTYTPESKEAVDQTEGTDEVPKKKKPAPKTKSKLGEAEK
ncbi:MAG: trigger factor [Anaerolineaceae bacterium]|nr:trigger factor [Anaerolineaceae bacterium]MBN2677655.1 trigger factor [Anaerolineaceae bacterium]